MVVPAKAEANAINAIQSYFYYSEQVDTTGITLNDKGASIDGKISLYNLSSVAQYTKENKICDITVQVKGRSGGLSKRRTFAIDYRDIYYYWENTNGVIYFCVSLKNIKPEIYYTKLTPIFLQSLLKQKNKQDKRKAIQFDLIPKDPDEFINILLDFNEQCLKQPKTLLTLDKPDISNLKLYTSINAKPQYHASILKSGVTLYRQIIDQDTGKSISIPFDFGRAIDIFKVSKGEFITSNKLKVPAVLSVSQTTNEKKITAGAHGSISLKVTQAGKKELNTISLEFTPHGDYKERLNDVNFLISLLTDLESFGEIDTTSSIKYKDELGKQVEYLTGIIEDLSALGILIDFDPDDLTEKETKLLSDILAVMHGNIVPKPGLQSVKMHLLEHQYAFIIYKQSVINILSPNFIDKYCIQETQDDEHIRLNPYTFLRKELYKFPSFSSGLVISGFQDLDFTSFGTANYYVEYVLDLIKNFDISEDTIFLKLGLEILNKVKSGVDPEIILINTCQILIRQNKDLGITNLSKLVNATQSDDKRIQLSALILLKQKDEILNLWNSLNLKEQDEIVNWPIAKLSPVMLREKDSTENEQ